MPFATAKGMPEVFVLLRSRDVAFARAHFGWRVAQLDSDGVPTAVAMTGARISEIVLLAQLIGDAGDRRIEIAEVAHDLRASAAVVGDLTQRHHVHAIVASHRSGAAHRRITARLRHRNATRATAATREGKWNRQPRLRLADRRLRTLEGRLPLAVDAHRIHQHFGLAHDLLYFRDADAAAGVVAVGDDHDGLFAVLSALRHRY